MAIPTSLPRFVDTDELKQLWRILERLQADVMLRKDGAGYVWNNEEKDALVTVMDAIKDTEQMMRAKEQAVGQPGND